MKFNQDYKYFMSACISIITTFHNSSDYILDCLKSVQNIKYQERIEHILVDDGSTDNTVKIIKKNALSNQHIYVNTHLGRGNALNLAINQSKGKYLCILDSDDLINPNWINFILESSNFLNIDTDTVVFGNVIHFQNYKLPSFSIEESFGASMKYIKNIVFYFRNPVPHVGTIFQKELIKSVNNYSSKRTAQFDWDLWLKLVNQNAKFLYFDNVTAAKRLHSKQSFERQAHLKYTLKGVSLQVKKSFMNRPLILPAVIFLSAVRLVWSFLPQNFRSSFYKK